LFFSNPSLNHLSQPFEEVALSNEPAKDRESKEKES
jgi:hypothetical protein